MKELIISVPDRFGETLKPEKINTEIVGELVRCKDCKHWEQSNGHCPFNSIFTNADWFCADAERKEVK